MNNHNINQFKQLKNDTTKTKPKQIIALTTSSHQNPTPPLSSLSLLCLPSHHHQSFRSSTILFPQHFITFSISLHITYTLHVLICSESILGFYSSFSFHVHPSCVKCARGLRSKHRIDWLIATGACGAKSAMCRRWYDLSSLWRLIGWILCSRRWRSRRDCRSWGS